MLKLLRRNFLIGAGCAAALMAGAPAAFAAQVELGFLVDNNPATVKFSQALIDAFMAKNPDIKINLDTRPGGTEGDNLIKTKLATDDMDDVFLYNAGSLFQAMNPQKNLVDLTSEPFQANVLDSFKTVVTNGGKVFGAPIQGAMGGGVLYNKRVYADLGLESAADVGGLHEEQRRDQGQGRHRAGHSDVQGFLDLAAFRARRFL